MMGHANLSYAANLILNGTSQFCKLGFLATFETIFETLKTHGSFYNEGLC